jgi:hypothetical protein
LSVIVGQYVWEGGKEQMGGMKGLDYKYGCNKPIELNETAYYPFQYRTGDPIEASRVEAWEFMVGGGAGFNHLNSRFTAEDPAGNTPDNARVLGSLRNLKDFLYSFDFVKMRADKAFVVSGVPRGTYCRGISQQGEQYALYHHHSRLAEGDHYYVVEPGNHRETLELALPAGTYKADWVDPASGAVLNTATFTHQGGNRSLAAPEHRVDIALRIRRTGPRAAVKPSAIEAAYPVGGSPPGTGKLGGIYRMGMAAETSVKRPPITLCEGGSICRAF